MDVALEVVVTGEDARIALLEAAAPHSVIDQSQARVVGGDIDGLVSTLVSTDRMLTETGHRLVATRVCSDNPDQVAQVVAALHGADLTNVTSVSQPEAATAAGQVLTGDETAASPATPGDSAALTGMSPATAMAESVWSAESTAMSESVWSADPAMTTLSSQGSQLAYSEVDDGDGLDDSWVPVPGGDGLDAGWVPVAGEFDPDQTGLLEQPTPERPKALLLGSTVAAAVVVGFAGLAVSVAIGIRPSSSEQAIRMQPESVPGNYFPTSPGQGVRPDGENWTAIEQLPPKGVNATVRTFQPKSLTQPLSNTGSVIDLYPDGTFGVRDAAAALPVVPGVRPGVIPPVPGVAGGLDPFAQVLVARLIPDFSKFTPTDVLAFMSNMVPTAAMVGTNALSNLFATAAGPSLADLGSVVAVSPLQGALFAAAPADTTSVFEPATLTTSVPKQLFSAGLTPAEKSALLPAGITEITELPDTGTNPGLSPLSAPITDVDALKPAIVGTGPAVTPDKEAAPVFPDVAPTPTKPDAPEGPKDSPVTELPENAPAPGEQGPSEVPGLQVPGSEAPGEQTPGEVPPEAPTQKQAPSAVPTEAPEKQAPEEAPAEVPTQKQAPVDVPAEVPTQKQAPVEVPAEVPTQKQAPAEVPAEAPTQKQAPPVQREPSPAPVQEAPAKAPEPAQVQQAPEPAPVQQAPPKAPEPAPVQQAPPKAPVQQAPPKAPVRQAPPKAPKAPSMPGLKMPDLSGGLSG